GGFNTQWLSIDGSVFHDASRPEDYTSIETGDIDSKSARLTITPSPAWALQISRGELGEELAQRTISSASLSYALGSVAMTALWTQREYEDGRDAESAYGFELLMRPGKHSFMARAEWVDRPATFPEPPFGTELEQT